MSSQLFKEIAEAEEQRTPVWLTTVIGVEGSTPVEPGMKMIVHADGRINARNWREAKQDFADRILDLVEEHAPDVRSCIIGSVVETPEDIERINPNFVGGDCVSGSHHLDQNFFCRPFF